VPLSQAVLLDINPREKVGQAMAIWGAGIMVGPILGPLLGGWLTENFDWRWVFFINLPVGIFAFWGIARYLPESRPRGEKLDIFGFVTLSLAIGMLQLFLDRGEQLDWFDSWEIKLEAAAALVAFGFFVVHTWTVQGVSFFDRDLLKDRNFVTGLLFAFIVGMILFATMALLPNFLQGLMGYPVIYTGEVTAPRGVGTMIAMIIVGRLVQRIDVRAIMAVGFGLTAFSLYQMTRLTLQMDSSLIIMSGFIQGLGIGFTFVPLSTATFATLAPRLRNQGTPIFSLLRNIGSSVGISIRAGAADRRLEQGACANRRDRGAGQPGAVDVAADDVAGHDDGAGLDQCRGDAAGCADRLPGRLRDHDGHHGTGDSSVAADQEPAAQCGGVRAC
jgi:DHA2 family multidrug resistance protein